MQLIDVSKTVDEKWVKFNENQKIVVSVIVQIVKNNEFQVDNLFFLDDFESIDKIFVQNIVMTKSRFENRIVLVVTSSNIVVTLLNDDQTTHARFKISLDFDDSSICDIKKSTNRYELIRKTNLIFWNEIFMRRKHDMMTINQTISDLCDVDESISFDDKIVCFCDDFKQCLSIVSNRSSKIIINICIQDASFWDEIYLFRLNINMRLHDLSLIEQERREIAQFAKKMLKIDDVVIIESRVIDNEIKKIASWNHDFLTNNTQSRLIDSIYLTLRYIFFDVEYLRERVILVVVNVDVRRINNSCVNRLMNDIHLKYNSNILVDFEMREKYDDECFHNYDEISLSSHVFRLKIDMSIMIIRNLKFLVMCNDTRARLTHVDRNVLKTKVIDEKHADIKILISRISLQSKDDESNRERRRNVSCSFIRRQYLIRSTFIMTINKSQKQFLKHVDVDIRIREIFTHD